ncbi:TetR/AcrR family transcriptional regulator [Halobacillus salinarum]|uniref:TetR/AcrR family transcriptional regulator n=1 Tax=Halobacillus salinarum TaxID=2932257 RepID=A0ABY4EJ23_9BACI|nr:TetR/AcrR family transcriptional regulator [Halobacillus salinarum]UOQ43634.1 TetR/AcrR family transcriptional regulator [Halobacillus salinarum]
MPKGFKQEEKQHIQQALLAEGRELFCQFGLQKTSIQDITKKVGIAAGTFYKFFQSKEELYFDILANEEEEVKNFLNNLDVTNSSNPKSVIKQHLLTTIEMVEKNPLMRQIYLGDNMNALSRKIPEEKLANHLKEDNQASSVLITNWKQQGVIIKYEPELVTGLFRSLFMLTLHKKEIGEDIYRATIELHVDLLVEGLIEEEVK